MKIQSSHIAYKKTNSFSNLVCDYIDESEQLKSLVVAFPSVKSMADQIIHKKENYIHRELLYTTLNSQYKGIEITTQVADNLKTLSDQNTFTICTAHQPNIFTGYLYFIYKIIHTIRLAEECRKTYPTYNFVPIFYMGSEDNDIDEIGVFHYNQQTYHWQTNQKGACGRMHTFELKHIVSEIKKTFNDSNLEEFNLIQLFEKAYNGVHTLAEATRIIVNALFGKYGLLVIDGDDDWLKSSMKNVFREEIFRQSSFDIVNQTLDKIGVDYKVQAKPRPINLFYLKGDLRERIERVGDQWHVLNSKITFSQIQIENEIENYPQNFSPNVILRPLYQETILPNVAFVGGGGELSYWLELKSLFEHHKIVYPVIFLRNSVQWITKKTSDNIKQMSFQLETLFLSNEEIFKGLIQEGDEMKSLQLSLNQVGIECKKLIELGGNISPSLGKSIEAHVAKIERIEIRIQQKFKAHLKKKKGLTYSKIETIKDHIFPNGNLQERYDNFLTIYKLMGSEMFDVLIKYQQPFGKEFLVLSIEE